MPPQPPKQPKRLILILPEDLCDRIDEFRWRNRIPSRAAAIRTLIEAGLAQATPPK